MRLLLVVLAIAVMVEAQKEYWTAPYIDINNQEVFDLNVTEDLPDKVTITFTMNENLQEDYSIGTFKYSENGKLSLQGSERDKAYFKEIENKVLITAKNGDYESDKNTFDISVTQNNFRLVIKISLKNLNDNEIILSAEGQSCQQNENNVPPTLSNCQYKISDKDGIDSSIQFLFDLDDRFDMTPTADTLVGQFDAIVTLRFLQKEDFETANRVILNWTAKDDDFEDSMLIIIVIKDQPDMPPVWSKLIGSREVDELQSDSFEVEATDGDLDIKAEITYSIDCHNLPLCDNNIVINTNIVQISRIELDDSEINSISFDIIATEEAGKGGESAYQTVVLLIKDVNNNKPLISISNSTLIIEEHSNKVLDTIITIEDKDSSDFGTYEVTLTSSLNNYDINDIMKIIPNTGYKKGSFSISIAQPNLLDYDDVNHSDLHNFKIFIHSQDNIKDPSNSLKNQSEISISVTNINDEIPIWDSASGYHVQIDETFGRDQATLLPIDNILTFFALDKDIGAFGEVSYEIVGTASQRLFALKNSQPNKGDHIELETIFQPDVQIFDYENQNEVLVSIRATDPNPDHAAITQLTIEVIDVNDELPTLKTTNQATSIEEDTQVSDVIKDKIVLTATDPDSQPDLEITINWDKTYALKLGTETADFDPFKGCFEIEQTNDPSNPQKVTATLKLDVTKSPNYDKFDTIYLYVEARDKNGEVPIDQTATVTLIINIININNRAPEFDLSTFEDMKIKEHADDGQVIGVVKATDPDNLDKITYDIVAVDPAHANLVTIQNDGKIMVKKLNSEIGIEADPNFFELKYNIIAKDSQFKPTKLLTIEIIDANDHYPEFELNPSGYSMKEHDEPNWGLIKVTDIDRDETHYKYKCTVSNDFFEAITIDPLDNQGEGGCEIALISGKEIERDGPNGISIIEISLTVHNYLDDINPNIVTKILQATIEDINDNHPNVKEGLVLEASENDKIGHEISALLEGEDSDVGENAKITFVFDKIESAESVLSDIKFDIQMIDDKRSKLILKTDLMGYYGDYNLYFKATDHGTPALSNEIDHPVKFHVKKYNEKPVIFHEAPTKIILLQNQKPNAQLIQWGGSNLEPLKASDQQGGKYNIQFDIVDNNGDTRDDTFFKLVSAGSDSINLQLKTIADLPEKYVLRLSAQSIDAEPVLTAAYHDLTIWFVENNAAPIFYDPAPLCVADEEDPGLLSCILPEARYLPEDTDTDFEDVYYHIYEKESLPSDAYKIENIGENKVSVIKKLDLLIYPETYFTVEASPSNIPGENPNEKSLLKVTLKLNDINNHPPEFVDKDSSFDAMMIGMISGDKVMSVKAIDSDAGTTIVYTIDSDSYNADQTLPQTSSEALDIVNEELILKFKVQSSMTGSIECAIIASDGKHTIRKNIKLYVLSDVHLTSIVFDNPLTVVQDKYNEIIIVLEQEFNYGVKIRNIIEATGTTDEVGSSSTEVIAFFIDTEQRVGIEKEVIKSKMNNIAFYALLQKAFVKLTLLLRNVYIAVEEESLEETYKLALIIVAVVSGVLLIALIGFFTYKLRTQHRRLDRMDKAEARRPTMIQAPNLPGANRRATQVVNPNFKLEKEFDEITDDLSYTNSGKASSFKDPFDDDDEDFVGVENSDIFKSHPTKF